MKTTENLAVTVPALKARSNSTALAFIFIVTLLDVTGLTILIPVMPYIVRQYSPDALMVTLMSVIYAAAQFIGAPILGKLSDRHGRRPILLLCLLGSAGGYYLFGLGGALWVLFLSRLIDGFTGGNISTATAYIADISPRHERARNFGFVSAAFGLGFILGPALGGALGQLGLAAPAYAAGSLSLLSAGLGFFILPESLPKEKRSTGKLGWSEANPISSIVELLRRRDLNSLLVTQSVYNFVTAGFNSLVSVYLVDKFGVQPLSIAGLLVVIGITNIIVQAGLVGRLVARFGEEKLVLSGILFQTTAILGTGLLSSFRMLYPLHFISSGGAGLFRPAVGALMANSVPAEEQGRLSGVSTSLSSLMSVFGPLFAGLAYDHLAPFAPFWMGAVLLGGLSAWLWVKAAHPTAVVDPGPPQR